MLILIFVGCLNCEVATHASDPRGGTTASGPSSGGGQASQKRAGTVVRTVEEHELPWRLQRKDIDEAEMAYINSSWLQIQRFWVQTLVRPNIFYDALGLERCQTQAS
uniref:Uncharacterized protein n=1 Tax=Timema monikensis TaxID=170555 RepID=A0A7R9EIZ4_9NEOP|nr:unnamed protein product [Timema monikensis]